MARYRLLTVNGNPKAIKSLGQNVHTAILHFAPAKKSVPYGGFNVCPSADGCEDPCLDTAGRGGIPDGRGGEFKNVIQAARIRKTVEFTRERYRFLARLFAEVGRFEREALKSGLTPAVRLNGTSDIRWERVSFGTFRNIMEAFPRVTFYDYTKLPAWRAESLPVNYHLTFSLGASMTDETARAILKRGHNLAVVFDTAKGRALPETWNGFPVIDGDESDARFLDPRGCVVGLRAKGRAKRDTSGFVVRLAPALKRAA